MNKKQRQENKDGNNKCNLLQIDMIERLPTPYGLVRNGVAPDHPEVKIVQHDFDSVLFGTTTDASSSSGTEEVESDLVDSEDHESAVNFYGNVTVGTDVSLEELRKLYDIVVLAYGCESDRTLNIPGGGGSNQNGGESQSQPLQGVLSAREFVAWYNGHVDFDHVGEIVSQALNSNDENHIVVLGVGNVALDCARILAKTRNALNDTDISSNALNMLHSEADAAKRRIISVVGRRGHVQGAFTIKELRELTKLHEDGTGSQFVVRQDELELGTTSATKDELSKQRPKTRIDKLLRKHATSNDKSDVGVNESCVHLRFLLNPIRFDPDPDDDRRLGSVVCERTQLQGEPGSQKAIGTGELESIPAHLVSHMLTKPHACSFGS